MDQQVNEISDQQIYAAYHLYENGAKLAEKEGDHEAAIALREQAKAKLLEAYQYIGNLNDQNNPAAGMSGPERVMAGARAEVGTGLDKIGNLVRLVPDEKIAQDHAIDAPLMRTPGGTGGALVGQALTALPIAGGAAGIVSRLGELGAKVIANPVGRGVVEGAAQGLTMSDPGNRTTGALVGGGAGAALPLAGMIGSRVINGATRTPAAEKLMQSLPKGTLTPGLMNPGGVAGTLEQNPATAWLFRKAREQARDEYGRAATQHVAMPGTVIPLGEKSSMVKAASRSFDPYYAQARGFEVFPKIMNTRSADVPLDAALNKSVQIPGASDKAKSEATDWLQKKYAAMMDKATARGRLLSDDVMEFRQDVRNERSNNMSAWSANKDRDAKTLGAIYQKANDHLTAVLNSQLPQDARAAVQAADSRYGALMTLKRAASKSGDMPAISHAHLSSAVKTETPMGPYAEGADVTRRRVNGVEVPGTGLRDLARQGRDVFEVDPHMRTGASNPSTAAMALLAHHAPLLTIPAGIGAAALGKFDLGRRIAQGVTGPQVGMQKMLSRLNQPMRVSPSGRDFQPDLSAIREDLGKLMGRYATASALQRQQLLGNE